MKSHKQKESTHRNDFTHTQEENAQAADKSQTAGAQFARNKCVRISECWLSHTCLLRKDNLKGQGTLAHGENLHNLINKRITLCSGGWAGLNYQVAQNWRGGDNPEEEKYLMRIALQGMEKWQPQLTRG